MFTLTRHHNLMHCSTDKRRRYVQTLSPLVWTFFGGGFIHAAARGMLPLSASSR